MISAGKPGASTIAKCYRLVHAVFATAVEDGIVMRNPCVVKGASAERPAERPVATIEEVFEIADAIAPELRAAVLAGHVLRTATRRDPRPCGMRHLDLLHRTVRIEEQYQELSDGTLVLGPPKTDAGVRTIVIPQVIIPDLEHHLASVPLGADGLAVHDHQRCAAASGNAVHRVAPGDEELSASPGCASTTSATPATHWPPRPGRARRS